MVNANSTQVMLMALLLTVLSAVKAQAETYASALLERSERLAQMEGHATESTTGAGTRALARYAKEKENMEQAELLTKTIRITSTVLTDNQGQKYIGGLVPKTALFPYLQQMQQELGDEFAVYRQNQMARDHSLFHLTLVNPYEYQTITKDDSQLGKTFNVTLYGLGKVAKGSKSALFVVAESSEAQLFRQTLLLKSKDFHVTLGFKPEDVHGVRKNRDTLLVKTP